jgi:aspartyl-tRNA(Asn)/glutamyl-tRNA(Gln) amidotransferase subunit A
MAMPTSADELCYLPISRLAEALKARRLSPVELVEHYLQRIDRLDGELHAYITVTAERARSQAIEVERDLARGDYRGPLHGIPVALKDLYDTAGLRTTGASRLMADRVPAEDSTCARLLDEAGTILLGKLNLHEFAFGGADPEGLVPPARNPWDLARIPAGSSSGSGAALAAGLCAGSLGSDTGGSIRSPAGLCGIVGHKPTYGLCSRYGVLPLSWSLDHAGPMARTVEDCAILLQAIAKHDPRDPASARVAIPDYRAALGQSLDGVRVGAPFAYLESIDELSSETFAAYQESLRTLERLGARVEPIDLPWHQHFEVVGQVILLCEAFSYHESNYRQQPQLYGKPHYSATRAAALLSAADYLAAQRGRAAIRRHMARLLQRVDLLALPTATHPAVTFEEEIGRRSRRISFTRPFNITGQPTISIPCGFSSLGLPIGLQLAGRPFEDAGVLRVAHAYEQATEWHTRHPSFGAAA